MSPFKYGKRGSLLKPLSHRRRQKHLLESPSKEKPEPLAARIPSDNESDKEAEEAQRYNDELISEMASRLLDDFESSLSGGDTQPHDTHADSANAVSSQETGAGLSTPERGSFVLSPDRVSPVKILSQLSTSKAARALRFRKYSPNSQVKSPGRRSRITARTRPDISEKKTHSGSLQAASNSKSRPLMIDPLKSHPVKFSAPSPPPSLPPVDHNGYQSDEISESLGTQPKMASPEEINRKVQAMLAATTALKGPPKQSETATSMLNKMAPTKVLAKVSQAWGRLQAKTSGADVRDEAILKPVNVNERRNPLKSRSSRKRSSRKSPSGSPITTMEIRLNEGGNLNKRKVQRIVGGKVVRKPVADDGKSLRSGRSLDDPFTDSMTSQTSTSFENRLRSDVELETRAVLPIPRNPFESEKGFDNDIEDRILSTTPVGSSTPRIRLERVSPSTSDGSFTMQNSKLGIASVGLVLDRAALKLDGQDTIDTEAFGSRSTQQRQADSFKRLRHNTLGPVMNRNINGSKLMKKHPSPSKEALENLEAAFRQYTHLKNTGASQEELDEFTSGFINVPRLLSRDKNRLVSNPIPASYAEECSGSSGRAHVRATSSSSMHSRRLSPPGNPLNLRRGIRLAPPYRPPMVGPDDMDELH